VITYIQNNQSYYTFIFNQNHNKLKQKATEKGKRKGQAKRASEKGKRKRQVKRASEKGKTTLPSDYKRKTRTVLRNAKVLVILFRGQHAGGKYNIHSCIHYPTTSYYYYTCCTYF
jgi:hypothetical protein